MYNYYLLFSLGLILLVNNIHLISPLKHGRWTRGGLSNILPKFNRNLIRGGHLSHSKGNNNQHEKEFESRLSDSSKNIQDSSIDPKLSRIELVLGSTGIKLLNKSSVLVIGANDLSYKIITHLIRSGVSSISIWDANKRKIENIIREILILNPDSNVKQLHTEPFELLVEDLYSSVIFSNQPLDLAIRVNKKFRKKNKFVYASTAGTYGLILSDLGDHRVEIRSDDSYPEHQCKVLHSGNETCLELSRGSEFVDYKTNDKIEVRFPDSTEKFKLLNVSKSKNGTIKLWIYTKNRKLESSNVYIRKVEDDFVLNFYSFEKLLTSLLNQGWLDKFLNKLIDRKFIKKLFIGPSFDENLNSKSLSVLSSFIALGKTNWYKSGTDSELDVHNFYNLSKEVYPDSDYEVVSGFNELKGFNVPGLNSLVGALASQEVIKGITHIFTTSDVIVIDRSDIFRDESGKVSSEYAKESIDNVSKLSYLVIGSGALGCDYLKLLAEMGIKDLTLVDNDVVDVSNLSRQVLFTINDIGKPKAESALRNLNLIHNVKGYKHYNILFSENSFGLLEPKFRDGSNLVAISAVDNIEGRVSLDNFCVQNKVPLIESGIYGMKCSTSFTVPYLTESFSGSISSDSLNGERYSCSVKGKPETIEDCVFYSLELFGWIFGTQHVLLTNFIRDPVKLLKQSLNTGSEYFYNLIEILNENLDILNETDPEKRKNKIRFWASKTYDKYVGYDSNLSEQLISTLVTMKENSLKSFNFDSSEYDLNKIKTLVNQGFNSFDVSRLGNTKRASKESFFKELDQFMNDNKSTKSQFVPLVLEEETTHSGDFVYLVSNLRARKFGIPESDKVSILRRAKNIVPSVSTCVSIASSLSLLEIYKLPILSRHNMGRSTFIEDFKSRISKGLEGMNEFVTVNHLTQETSLKLDNTEVKFKVFDSEIKFYIEDRLIFTIKSFDYGSNRHLSTLFRNHFFNGSTMKYTSNSSEPPKIFTINDKNSILNGLSLSCWDYISVKEPSQNLLKMPFSTLKLDIFDRLFGRHTKKSLYLCELINLIELLFSVKVDALTFTDGYVLVDEFNSMKPLRELVSKKQDQILHIVARDKSSNKPIELPDIKYSI